MCVVPQKKPEKIKLSATRQSVVTTPLQSSALRGSSHAERGQLLSS